METFPRELSTPPGSQSSIISETAVRVPASLGQTPMCSGLRKTVDGEGRIKLPADLPAHSAGLFRCLGYNMIRLAEKLPDMNPDPAGLPRRSSAAPLGGRRS